MPDRSSYSEYDTREAWERFVRTGSSVDERPPKVREEILDSWRRSRDSGVDAASLASRKVYDEQQIHLRRERNTALRKAASAAFKRLEPHLKEARTILILADDQGVIIDAIGDAHVLDEGQEIHLELGGDWSEKTIGTNGIGTALKTGKPAYVHATEHFAEGVQAWTCAGAPIFDPFTQTIIGVVDLSGPPQIFRQHNVALVLAAAREIDETATCVLQSEQLGTGHAVLQARPALEGFSGDVIVLYGDTPFIRPETLEAMAEARRSHDVVVLGFTAADPGKYGRLVMEGDALMQIVEFKDAGLRERAIDFCNSGVISASAETLFALLDRVGNDNASGEYYLTDIVALAREAGLSATAVSCDEAETMGVNSRVDLAAAEAGFQSRKRAEALIEGYLRSQQGYPECVRMLERYFPTGVA